MNLPEFYNFYFETAKHFGLMAYTIDQETLKVSRIKSGFYYYFQIFHTWFLAASGLNAGVSLACNLYSPNATEFQISVQILFFFGLVMLFAIGASQLWYATEIGNLFTALLQLESHLSTGSSPYLAKSKKSWLRIRLLQVKLVSIAWMGSMTVYVAMFIFQPRFPSFVWNIVPHPHEIISPKEEFWKSSLTRFLIGFPDVFVLSSGWVHLLSIDLLLGIISSHISYYLKVIRQIPPDSREGVKGFKALHILITIINDALAMGLIIHMALMSLVILCLLYGLIGNNSPLAFIFFFGNFFGCVGRMLFLLIPIANLEIEAEKVTEHFEETTEGDVIRRELVPLRTFCISAGGIYKIDKECVFHYVNFLITYFVVITSAG